MRSAMFRSLLLPLPIAHVLCFAAARADVILLPDESTFRSNSNVTTRDSTGAQCMDPQPPPPQSAEGVAEATSACADAQGNAGSASGFADVLADSRGADLSIRAGALAAAVEAPGPSVAFTVANAAASTTQTWDVTSATFYSLASDPFSESGGPTSSAHAIVSFSGGSAPFGELVPGRYWVTAAADADATARETGPLTAAAAARADFRITFADVDSPMLIRGNVEGDGMALAGILVEALDGTTVVDSTLSGDDGSYLLPEVTAPSVTVRASDPQARFLPSQSGPISPPTTYDFVLPEPDRALALGIGLLALLLVPERARAPERG